MDVQMMGIATPVRLPRKLGKVVPIERGKWLSGDNDKRILRAIERGQRRGVGISMHAGLHRGHVACALLRLQRAGTVRLTPGDGWELVT